ncbi:MAG: hypothetical protein JW384_03695 [Nitrosomonadaceae bacterium]|nr:hypothetical protein [Nitrosomonadaceae bacterium]
MDLNMICTVPMMLVYPIGIPLFYFTILFTIHKRINAIPDLFVESLRNANRSVIVGSLLRCSKDYVYASGMINQGSRDSQMATFRFKREVGRRLLIEYAEQLVAVQYAPLFEAYRPSLWYFECVECLRRLSFDWFAVLLYPGENKQVWLAMIICMFWIILNTWHKPY